MFERQRLEFFESMIGALDDHLLLLERVKVQIRKEELIRRNPVSPKIGFECDRERLVELEIERRGGFSDADIERLLGRIPADVVERFEAKARRLGII